MKKDLIVKYCLLITSIFYATNIVQAEMLYGTDYVSPESYAVNEADMLDYRYVAPPKKLNIDDLDNYTPVPYVEEEISTEKLVNEKIKKSKKVKEEDPEAYKKRLSYKIAKWWVDERYKREESHHGAKHEIKVKTREEYEKQLIEKETQQEEL